MLQHNPNILHHFFMQQLSVKQALNSDVRTQERHPDSEIPVHCFSAQYGSTVS